jgi:hypothetical protein
MLGEELKGNIPVQVGVVGLVDHAHTSLAKLFQNYVMQDGLTDHLFLCTGRKVLIMYRCPAWKATALDNAKSSA